MPNMKIGVLVNDNESSRMAFEKVKKFTELGRDAVQVHLITLISIPGPSVFIQLHGHTTNQHMVQPSSPVHDLVGDEALHHAHTTSEIAHENKHKAEEMLNKYLDEAKAAGFQVPMAHIIAASDKGKAKLVEFLEKEGFEYVFVGSRGLKGIQKMMDQSFSDYILHNYNGNVVIARK